MRTTLDLEDQLVRRAKVMTAPEVDAEFITADRDFARFPKLRFRHPLAP